VRIWVIDLFQIPAGTDGPMLMWFPQGC